MRKQTVLIGALAVALLLALVKIVWTEAPQSDPFITKLPERISLPSQDTSNEEFRTERFAEDGFTRIEAVREFRDGVTETVKFREDGTLSGYTELYPAGADGTRQLKSNAAFDASGRFFVSHQVHRKDGSLERTGEKLRDGRYESKFYWDDGTTVARHRFFDSKYKFVSEDMFDPAGVRIGTRRQDGDNFQMTLYHPTGAVWVTYVKGMYAEAGRVFAEDGQTLLFEFEQDPWTSKELHYKADGKPDHWRLSVRMAGSTDINVVNPDGSMHFKQVWRNAKLEADGPVVPILSRIIEARNKMLYRTIEVGKDGKATSVTYPTKTGTVIKQLADGKRVTSIKTLDQYGKVVSEVAGSGEVETFDPAMFVDPPHASRPSFVDEKAPPMVYDYK